MNICFVAYTLYDSDYRVRRYVEALDAEKNNVDVFILKGEDHESRQNLNGANIFRVRKRKLKEQSTIYYLANLILFAIKTFLLITYRHFKYKYNIIHVHNLPDFLVFVAIIPKLTGAKLILDIHDIMPELYSQKYGINYGSKINKCLLLMEKICSRFVDKIIIANDLWRKKLIKRTKIAPQKCLAILNYPNPEFFREPLSKTKQNGLVLIYPGTISKIHGVDIAISALALIKREYSEVKLMLPNTKRISNYVNFIKVLIKELSLEENVEYFEPVPIQKLSKIYEKADIGIVPKRGGIFADEAFSTKIPEFMSMGIPVVASKTKIDQYYFDESQIKFFEKENFIDMASSVLKISKNENLKKTLIKQGKKFIKKNNWKIKKDLYLDILKELK